jgi:hypothetical protein
VSGFEESPVDFVYVKSCGAHGHHAAGVFDAFVGSRREIWVGGDCSGLIRESAGPVSFFTETGRAQWQAAGSPELTHGPSLELFAPGCLGSSRARLATLLTDPTALRLALAARSPVTLKLVYHLLGEMLMSGEFCRALHAVAAGVNGVDVLPAVSDQLGREGHGLSAIEHGQRLELIFNGETSALLGYQRFLVDPDHGYAPVGTLVSWSTYLDRRLVDALPPGTPPIPGPPCSPPGSGRGTRTRGDYSITTGYE